MAINFPNSPVVDEVFAVVGGPTWQYTGTTWKLLRAVTDDGAAIVTYTPAGTGAVTTTVKAKLDETVSVKDFGATGDGVTDDIAAIQAAIDAVATAGGGTVFFPRGTYLVSSALTISSTQHNIRLQGEGFRSSVLTKGSTDNKFVEVSDLAAGWNTAQGNTLASDAALGAQTLTLTAGKGANFSANTWVALISDEAITADNDQGEFVHVYSVATDVLTLSSPLSRAAITANNAEVRNVNWLEGFEVDGIGMDGNSHATGGGNVNANNLMHIYFANAPRITNCGLWEGINVGIALFGCLNAHINNLHGYDLLSDGVQGNSGSYGYMVVEMGMNQGAILDNLYADRVRHAYTTAGGLGMTHGEPVGTRITNGVAVNCRGSGWDTHPLGRQITFTNCVVLGSLGLGFQERSTNNAYIGCYARDCVASGMYVTSTASDTTIDSFRLEQTNQGTWDSIDWTTHVPMRDLGTYTCIDGMYLKEADQLVNNTTTLVADPDLIAPMAAYERVVFDFMIRYNSQTAADIKFTVVGPTGSLVRWSAAAGGIWNTSGTWVVDGEAAGATTKNFYGSGGGRWLHLTGYCETEANAGTIGLQWAQATANVSNTYVTKSSSLRIVRN